MAFGHTLWEMAFGLQSNAWSFQSLGLNQRFFVGLGVRVLTSKESKVGTVTLPRLPFGAASSRVAGPALCGTARSTLATSTRLAAEGEPRSVVNVCVLNILASVLVHLPGHLPPRGQCRTGGHDRAAAEDMFEQVADLFQGPAFEEGWTWHLLD